MDHRYLAHVNQNIDGGWVVHSLEQHLREVGRLATEMASGFNSAGWAIVAGLWHDRGNYRPGAQAHIALSETECSN